MPTLNDYLDKDNESANYHAYFVPLAANGDPQTGMITEFVAKYPMRNDRDYLKLREYRSEDLRQNQSHIMLVRRELEGEEKQTAMLQLDIPHYNEPVWPAEVAKLRKMANVPTELESLKKASGNFAQLFDIPKTESLVTKKEAIRKFLEIFPKPVPGSILGSLFFEYDLIRLIFERRLSIGNVKLVVNITSLSPVDAQKEQYALLLLMHELGLEDILYRN
jgi:hypothetical protein